MAKFPAAFEDSTGKIQRLSGEIEFLPGAAATTGDVLTVQADKSIAAQPGGGGAGGVQVVTVPVSSAEILDLFNTPVVLIPGVPGFFTTVIALAITYVAGVIPYLDGGGTNEVRTVSLIGNPSDWGSVNGVGFWDQAASQLYAINSSGAVTGQPAGDWDGRDVVLLNDTANPTLGDGTLLVTLSYFLAPTV